MSAVRRVATLSFEDGETIEVSPVERVEDTPSGLVIEVSEPDAELLEVVRGRLPDGVYTAVSRGGLVDAYIRVGEPALVRVEFPYPWAEGGKEEADVWGVVVVQSRSSSTSRATATLIAYYADRVFRLDGASWERPRGG